MAKPNKSKHPIQDTFKEYVASEYGTLGDEESEAIRQAFFGGVAFVLSGIVKSIDSGELSGLYEFLKPVMTECGKFRRRMIAREDEEGADDNG